MLQCLRENSYDRAQIKCFYTFVKYCVLVALCPMGMHTKVNQQSWGKLSEAGFALPIAIGVGLIMLLLGITMVVRSQNDQINASAQKSTAKSLAAAESGVSKVQAFLNRTRTLAMYPDAGPNSWVNRNALNICPRDGEAAELDALFPDGSGDWPDVDPNESSPQPLNGEFRVVNYVYSGTLGQPGNSGSLTVQGRVNAGEPSESIAQVQVKIPIQPVNQVAVLWAGGSINGGPIIKGTVVGDCLLPDDDDLKLGSAANVVRIDQGLPGQGIPNVPALPVSPPSAVPVAIPASGPLGAENSAPGTVYRYQIPTLKNRSLEIWSGSAVELWTSGEIDLKGQTIKCVQTSGAPCSANDAFKLTVYASGPPDTALRLDEGSVLCNVHFHAPTHNVEFSLGGTPTGDCTPTNPSTPAVQIVGAFWINNWDGGTSSVTLTPITNGPEVTAVLPPQLEPITQWETQQVVVDP
jgi:hypothetical protein